MEASIKRARETRRACRVELCRSDRSWKASSHTPSVELGSLCLVLLFPKVRGIVAAYALFPEKRPDACVQGVFNMATPSIARLKIAARLKDASHRCASAPRVVGDAYRLRSNCCGITSQMKSKFAAVLEQRNQSLERQGHGSIRGGVALHSNETASREDDNDWT
jgi:hypothetical protein